ncbi:(2Fe-2S)-binding protein [Pseudonocardia benzenivorans]|jgi:carbon-monoxide dehydrogenase small subunit|uniref:Carbon-monoxide dehydrogenase (Acceptor) n=2 Tax=Pseudonocardia TaxID=1847 RepID=F4CY81_PSEUX|nr:(2Fe-2S)-binding protein [Pseudonocardia dioxanivorans]AEA24703.1 Carbon-monoxide dehydrogenase (acceptor) [Pseudonocardia dioxanivorans CB1190]GJF01222.1 (2Fe-2S)-binding protein [Pseudonocardia sp. D17]
MSETTSTAAPEKVRVRLTVNGTSHDLLVEPRTLLADLLRGDLGLTGTHLGCEQGVCGSCTVLVDGTATRSCLVFAAQLDGATVRTVESLGGVDGSLHPIQRAFHENHGLQCGFCTPGMLMGTCELLERTTEPDPDDVREALGGNLCRCTGYQNIVKSVCAAGRALAAERNGAQV